MHFKYLLIHFKVTTRTVLNLGHVTAGGLLQFTSFFEIVISYVLFGISEDSMCYSLTGIGLLLFGTLLVILKPYRSRKVNTYHTVITLYLAITTLTISTFPQAKIGDYWMAKLITVSYLLTLLPILVITVYVVYYCAVHCCFKSCPQAGKVLSQQRRKKFGINMEEEKPLVSSIANNYHSINTNRDIDD